MLLVEPDPAAARTITEHLIDLRLEVLVRSDGASALEALEGPPPDAVLCETVMPGIDGHTVLQAVIDRALPCPVLLMGAHVEVADVLEAWRSGAADFLPKPFSRRQLRDALRRAWARAASRAPARGGPRPCPPRRRPPPSPRPPPSTPGGRPCAPGRHKAPWRCPWRRSSSSASAS
ncbi:MAG: response regulator [Myxococcales bacterium]|nr:response regulator [Myxococcales bacterium]